MAETLRLSDPPGAPLILRFTVHARPGEAMALFAHATEGEALFASIDVQLRRRPASD